MANVALRNLVKRYGRTLAVRGINLECRDSEFLALLGPSGCGKSSTLRMIAGLEDITDGEIWIDDVKVNHLKPGDRDVAMAFESYALYPTLSVFDNMAFPLRAARRSRQYSHTEIERRVRDVASVLGIDDVLQRMPAQLSGGQMQRVSLGRALVREPKVFLFDEPISHLDARQRADMRAHLKRIHQMMRSTIVYVTHDQVEALSMADRIAVMDRGELQQVGTPEEVYNSPANLFVADFVGEPPMNLFDGELASEGGRLQIRSALLDLALDRKIASTLQTSVEHREVTIGIRPVHVRVARAKDFHHCVPGEVHMFESLGEEGVLTVNANGVVVKAVVPRDFSAQIGEPIWLSFPDERVHVFDRESGKAFFHGKEAGSWIP